MIIIIIIIIITININNDNNDNDEMVNLESQSLMKDIVEQLKDLGN